MKKLLPALALLLPLAPARAQNCAQTSVGLTPLPVLATGTWQGLQGGLYPGGSNVRPIAHAIDGMTQALEVVPRDGSGAPSATGKIVFLSIGMSNCTQEFSRFAQLANADPLKSPRVQLVDGAQGGQTAAIVMNPASAFWTVVDQRLAAANATAAQVQAIWFKEADGGPTSGPVAYAQTLASEFVACMQVIRDRFPNARIAFLASRTYGGYATTSLNPEPYAYAQGFACKSVIESQIAGSPALVFDPADGPVEAPWVDWGTYNWADGLVANPDGLAWACSDFQADGTHPSASGREKVAQRLLAFVHADPIAASFYLARPAPAAYGVGKTTSLGTLPTIGATGTPSLASGDFHVVVTHAVPGSNGLVFAGPRPDAVPFFLGTRWVGAPLARLPIRAFDGSGSASWPVAVVPALVGTTRFYQGWLRDPANPDGTNVALSDALRVVYSN